MQHSATQRSFLLDIKKDKINKDLKKDINNVNNNNKTPLIDT